MMEQMPLEAIICHPIPESALKQVTQKGAPCGSPFAP